MQFVISVLSVYYFIVIYNFFFIFLPRSKPLRLGLGNRVVLQWDGWSEDSNKQIALLNKQYHFGILRISRRRDLCRYLQCSPVRRDKNIIYYIVSVSYIIICDSVKIIILASVNESPFYDWQANKKYFAKKNIFVWNSSHENEENWKLCPPTRF